MMRAGGHGRFRAGVAVLLVSVALVLVGRDASAQCAGCPNPSFRGVRTYPLGISARDFTVADFDGDGYPDVAVSDYNGQSLTVVRDPGIGDPRPTVITPSSVYAIASADFDEDGNVDIVGVTNTGFALLRGGGDATFSAPIPFPAANTASGIAAADLDGDGHMDVLLFTSAGLEIHLGDGAGGFGPAQIVAAGQASGIYVVSDFVRDGIADVVFVAGSTLYLVPGSASRVFSASAIATVDPSVFLATADLNHDGIPDLAVLRSDLQTYIGDGSGGFQLAGSISGLSGSLALGDFDGDGNVDAAIGYDGDLTFFRGDGSGGLTPSTIVPGLLHGAFLASADLNRDGAMDLFSVAMGVSPSDVTVLTSRNGRLEIPAIFATTNFYPQRIAVGDFNSDGLTDVAISHFAGLDFLYSDASGTFHSGASISFFTDGGPVRLADVNRDGHLDIVVANPAYGEIYVWLGDGAGGFSGPATFACGSGPEDLVLADLNGDGFLDIVTANQGSNSISVLLGNGNGTFRPATNFGVPSPNSLVDADFDGDGHLDVAVAGSNDALTVLRGDGAGGFLSFQTLPAGTLPQSILAGDFTGDGHLDLAALSPTDSTISVLPGNGHGAFGARIVTSLGQPIPGGFGSQIAAGDFNQDGYPDLVLVGATGGSVEILSNAKDGSFTLGPHYRTGGSTFACVADANGDGLPDVFVANEYAFTVAVLENTNCRARALRVQREPSACGPSGIPLGTQPAVGVLDDGGNIVCDTGVVTASIASGTGTPGAILGGTRSVAAVAGVASYTDLSVDRDGAGYRLEFHHPSASVTRSRAFTLGPAPAAPPATNNGPVCAGQTLQLTASAVPGALYLWTGPNGFTSTRRNPSIPAVSASAAGDYSVTVRVNGCVSAAATTTVVVLALPSDVVTAPATACPRASGNLASAPDAGPGSSYAWTIQNGLIAAGQGTPSVTFTTGAAGPATLTVTVTDAAGCAATGSAVTSVQACAVAFYTLPPCRILDTRAAPGPQGGPPLAANSARTIPVGGVCQVPSTAIAVSANIVAVQPTDPGHFVLYPGGTARPFTSTLNYTAGQIRANNAILSLGVAGDLTIECVQGGGTSNVVIDVSGYFQ